MRLRLAAGSLVFSLLLTAGATAGPHDKSCLVCHQPPLFDAAALARSIHSKLACVDCHEGYDFSPHRAKAPERSPSDLALIDKLAKNSNAPGAFIACGKCHVSQVEDWVGSVHGRWLREPRPVDGPTCVSCHGSPHAIPASKLQTLSDKHRESAARCAACHEDPALVKAAGLSAEPAPSYRDSVHGRLLSLGSAKAPVCFNCHSAHDVVSVSSEASPVAPANRVATCAECHKGATANFAASFTHRHLSKAEQPIPWFTHIAFSWLTSLTLTLLLLHVLLDLGAELRRILRRKRGLSHEPAHGPGDEQTQVRFDRHQLVQHWMLIGSVLLLVVSGWPLRAAAVGPSAAMTSWFGGLHGAGLVHRIMALVMCGAAAYHLVYLTALLAKRRMLFSMLPAPRDVSDLYGNLLYFLGMRPERPRFGRFSYSEKFDYWAVFWGVAIMAGTGFIRWMPVWFGKWLPTGILQAAQIAHGEEATLAALALFVWHLYNVHLRPSVFPMSWIWVDGRITEEALRDEHPEEFERLEAARKAKAAAPAAEPQPPEPKSPEAGGQEPPKATEQKP